MSSRISELHKRNLATVALFALATADFGLSQSSPPSADPASCAGCHPGIYDTYRRTGMGRSFFRPRPERMTEDWDAHNTYYHQVSERHYTMLRRDGRYFVRRHQTDRRGQETNVVEKEVHYVLGSGNHARGYLHRAADGRLLLLPVSWYAASGGYWAMGPGYDRPDHKDFRRVVTQDCFFCHNGYPETEPPGREPVFPGRLPEGIDCQRCHGSGAAHIRVAQEQRPADEIRRAIVNPARLPPDRQIEVCLQCHLETTSFRLPYSIRRFERSVFSYRPGEPLEDYMLHFDRTAGAGYDEKFEVAHAAYRLRKSACFEKSGRMTCATCHNPHAFELRPTACTTCHPLPITQHPTPITQPAAADCLACHMPKRRTDDAVHVVMTDHLIQRRQPARDLLAPKAEFHDDLGGGYTGEVVLYYPPKARDSDLYLAVAQVQDGANLQAGIPRLAVAIARRKPAAAEFYFELAEAYRKIGQNDKAVPLYEEALSRKPGLLPATRHLGVSLAATGRLTEAEQVLVKAPHDAPALNNLGEVYLRQGGTDRAVAAWRKAIALDPDLAEAHNNLGVALSRQGDSAGAEGAFRDAVRVAPEVASVRVNYGLLLLQLRRLEEAREQIEAARRLDPKLPSVETARRLLDKMEADASPRVLLEMRP